MINPDEAREALRAYDTWREKACRGEPDRFPFVAGYLARMAEADGKIMVDREDLMRWAKMFEYGEHYDIGLEMAAYLPSGQGRVSEPRPRFGNGQ